MDTPEAALVAYGMGSLQARDYAAAITRLLPHVEAQAVAVRVIWVIEVRDQSIDGGGVQVLRTAPAVLDFLTEQARYKVHPE